MRATALGRLAIVVPVRHSSLERKGSRADRAALLDRCIRSLQVAVDYARAASVPFERVTIAVIDDHSPSDLSQLREKLHAGNVLLLCNGGRRGQAGALNFAVSEIDAEIFAFTDSDCTVAVDWIVRIAEHYVDNPCHVGVAGPNWLFRPASRKWAKFLTRSESELMRSLFLSDIDSKSATTTRVDCRNLSMRKAFLGHPEVFGKLFRDDGSVSVSGQASYFLKHQRSENAQVGFCWEMQTHHEPVSSLYEQIATYYRRGRWSSFGVLYSSGYPRLLTALYRKYWSRHFVRPITSWDTVLYVWPVHLAYWIGIFLSHEAAVSPFETHAK